MGISELYDGFKLYLIGTPEEIAESDLELDKKAYWPIGFTLELLLTSATIVAAPPLAAPLIFDIIIRAGDMYESDTIAPAGVIGYLRIKEPDVCLAEVPVVEDPVTKEPAAEE